MNFEDVIEKLNVPLNKQGVKLNSGDFQAVLIKKLSGSSIHPDLDCHSAGGQYHIALTGRQREIVPYLPSYLYKEENDSSYKRHFLMKIPIKLLEENLTYLTENQPDDCSEKIEGPNGYETFTTTAISKRRNGHQLELGDKKKDDENFWKFRKLLHRNDYLIFLQHRGIFDYTALGIKKEDASKYSISDLGKYYIDESIKPSNTERGRVVVDPELIEIEKRRENEKEILKELLSEDTRYEDLKTTGSLYFPEDMKKQIHNSILSSLKSGKSIMLVGPPGSGKTTIADNVASSIKDDDYVFSTATSDWTTFNTTGGYYPERDGSSLKFKPGIFLKCFSEGGIPVNKWLVIDEINRADIDKAFGELFTVMAGKDVDLPYTTLEGRNISIKYVDRTSLDDLEIGADSNYYMTPEWRIIATLNTWDKASLYEMSYAFMRRFAFIDVGIPEINEGVLEDYIENSEWGLNYEDTEEYNEKVEQIWITMNDSGREIGPAIIKDIVNFLKNHDDEDDDSPVCEAVCQYILPQIEGMIPDKQEHLLKELWIKLDNDETFKKIVWQRFEVSLNKESES